MREESEGGRRGGGVSQEGQGVVTFIPAVLTPTAAIKMRSIGQAEKLHAIKQSRGLFCTA